MTRGRRELLVLGASGLVAAAAGAILGPMIVQSRSGVAGLLAAKFSDLGGATHSLSEWTQRTLVCNFWATWCAPCIEEIPLLVAARNRFHEHSVEIVGIAIDSPAKVSNFVKQHGISYPVLIAQLGGIDLLRNLGNQAGGLPFTVILDKDRTVIHRKLGAFKRQEIEALLETTMS